MKKLILLLLFTSVLFFGCSGKKTDVKNSNTNVKEYYFTFTDSLNNEVKLEKKPENVAVLFSSYAEIWKLSGGEVNITVGDSVKRGFADESAILVNDGAGLKIDTETLIASQPDFVIITADFKLQTELCELLKENGIPCAAFREENLDDYLNILDIFSQINGNTDAYSEYGSDVENEIKSITDNFNCNSEIKYLFIRAGNGFSSTKRRTRENHFACVILDELGAKNVADGIGALSDSVSLEAILENQPDIIIIVPQGDVDASKEYVTSLFSEDGWNNLEAIKNNRYYFVEKELFNYKPNQRWAQSYSYMAGLLENRKQ